MSAPRVSLRTSLGQARMDASSKGPEEPRSDRRSPLNVSLSLSLSMPVPVPVSVSVSVFLAHPMPMPMLVSYHTRTHTRTDPLRHHHPTLRINHPLKRNERHKRIIPRILEYTRRRDPKRPQERGKAEKRRQRTRTAGLAVMHRAAFARGKEGTFEVGNVERERVGGEFWREPVFFFG